MRLLLDTHVWIWSQENLERIGSKAVSILSDGSHQLFVSPVSSLEIGRLVSGGKIRLEGSINSWVRDTAESMRCTTLSVSHEIAIAAYSLPGSFHKDPADRLLVSTARIHDLVLVTADERILAYPHVETMDPRD